MTRIHLVQAYPGMFQTETNEAAKKLEREGYEILNINTFSHSNSIIGIITFSDIKKEIYEIKQSN